MRLDLNLKIICLLLFLLQHQGVIFLDFFQLCLEAFLFFEDSFVQLSLSLSQILLFRKQGLNFSLEKSNFRITFEQIIFGLSELFNILKKYLINFVLLFFKYLKLLLQCCFVGICFFEFGFQGVNFFAKSSNLPVSIRNLAFELVDDFLWLWLLWLLFSL